MFKLVSYWSAILVIASVGVKDGATAGCSWPSRICCPGHNSSCKVQGPRESDSLNHNDQVCFCDALCIEKNDCCVDYNSTCVATIVPPKMPPYNGSLNPILNLSATFQGANLILDLRINPDIPEKLSVSVAGTSETYHLPSVSSTGVYNDYTNKASLVVTYAYKSSIPKPEVGSIIRGESLYTLFPVESNSVHDVTIAGTRFKSVKEDLQDLKRLCEISGIGNSKQKLANMFYPSRRRRQTSSKVYTIELHLFAEYSIYQKYFNICTSVHSQICQSKRQQFIQKYLFLVSNLVSNRFFSVANNNFQIRVKTKRISMDSNFQNDNLPLGKDNQGKTTINGSEALMYISKRTKDDKFDHTILITDHKIVFKDPNTTSIYTGSSNFGGMCEVDKSNPSQSLSVSMVRNRGLFSLVAAITHQLAHSMMVPHDGDTNDCRSNEQYLMAPFIDQLTPQNADHINYFSSCSIRSLQNYLQRQSANYCLNSETANYTISYTFPEYYNNTHICQFAFGPESKFCEGDHQNICFQIECWDPESNACVVRDDLRVMNGTRCGTNKMCRNSICSTLINSANPSPCFYADYLGNFSAYNNERFNCKMLNMSNGNACYNDDVRNRCCNACSQIKMTLNLKLGCEYGNRDQILCRGQQSLSNRLNSRCYDTNYEQQCCASCNVTLNIQGCRYGDRSDSCATIVSTNNCDSSTAFRCCYSCSSLTPSPTRRISPTTYITPRTTPPISLLSTLILSTPMRVYTTPVRLTTPYPTYSCTVGDIWSSWCRQSLTVQQCSQKNIMDNCCYSCYKLLYPNASLPAFTTTKFPDKCSIPDNWNDWCYKYADLNQCRQDSNIYLNCCATCSKFM